ncbi:MAG: penicillin-binding transpeptidase domain-containing protein, partial [Succinivibrio dextrinosolvens]|nr:penicillin-binding transpeptidase domain-containing protein [Succinivibrio dextrinosolvens]
LLRGVVENGTAKALNKCPFPIAGKTGTAQISSQGGYNKKNYTASFVGYFPADEPKYSCAVIIINPMGGKYYGASVSAPVLKDVAEKVYATRLGIEDVTKTSRANADKYTKASMAYYIFIMSDNIVTNIRIVFLKDRDNFLKS